MTGITGWVDHRRDLTCERETLLAMTAAMAGIGPDAERIWASPGFAAGCRLLKVTNANGETGMEAEAGPFVFERDGQILAVACVAGPIYNYAVVRRQLEALGYKFRTHGQAELVLYAYLEWAGRFAGHLEGAFSAAVWDPRDEELVLVRDRMGNKPLFYYPLPDGILFGSLPRAILAHPLVETVVDLGGLREMLGRVGPPGEAVYRGMREVKPGHLLRFSRGNVCEQVYWSLEGREHTDDLDTTVGTVRELLEHAVAQQFPADGSASVMLSGGLDSSSVTAIAARMLREHGQTLRTFTVGFAGQERDFRPDLWRTTPDLPYARQVAEHVGTEHTEIILDVAGLMDPVVRAGTVFSQDVPMPDGDINTSLYLLCRCVRDHTRTTMLGEVADALLGGFDWLKDSDIVNAKTFPWVALADKYGKIPGLGLGLIDPGLLKRLDMLGYAADLHRQMLTEVPYAPGDEADPQERLMREICYVHLTRWCKGLLTHDEGLSSAVGLEIRMPFCDHRLVQYIYSAPWGMKHFDGREKSLLRAAVKDLLPHAVLDRRKCPFPVTQDPGYEPELRKAAARLLSDPDAPARPLMDERGLKAVLDDPDSLALGWTSRTNVELLLQLDIWLTRYGVRLVL
jgi:asparagine synthase (glutamine-hydrolysing)